MKNIISLLLAICVPVLFHAAASAQDEITYHDRAQRKDVKITGTIQSENASVIKIKPGTGTARDVAVSDIRDVMYNLPARLKPDYRSAMAREHSAEKEVKADQRKKDLTTALAKYQELLPQVTGETVKSHVEFKIAQVTARLADDDGTKVDDAVAKLKQFKTAHASGWQIPLATDLLARLLEKMQDWAGAQDAYAELEKAPNLTPALRQDVSLKIAQVLVKAKKFGEAEKRLQDVARSVGDKGPERVRLDLVLAECQAASGKAVEAAKNLEAAIPKIADPDMKAQAYNTLGDCQRAANKPKDALWAYLWVDTIYNRNRVEHARALYHLVHVFKELKDDKRADEFRAKLKAPEFAGIEYQKMLTDEK